MGWDQETGRQGVMNFLLDHFEIDAAALLREAVESKLRERGITYEVLQDDSREEGDGISYGFTPEVIRFSDGRIFVEALTETCRGDDWGSDFYTFVEAGVPYVRKHNKAIENIATYLEICIQNNEMLPKGK